MMASMAAIGKTTDWILAHGNEIISPFADDKCGGLRPLGSCMLMSIYLNIPFILIIAAHVHTHPRFYPTLAIAIAMTVAAVAAQLFLPFVTLHRFLKQWRSKYLLRVRAELSQCEQLLFSTAHDSLPDPAARYIALAAHFDRVYSFGTWPYSPADRIRWLAPVTPFVGSFLLRLLFG
jgi:hypothetical protein